MALKFEILKKSGKSRLGKLHTKHGVVDTPAFMPVGTCGTVKAMMPESVAATGAQILLGNTYHLMLRPGADLVEKMGGLHKFICLLYTSDAADEEDSVEFGGHRIIKKKNELVTRRTLPQAKSIKDQFTDTPITQLTQQL